MKIAIDIARSIVMIAGGLLIGGGIGAWLEAHGVSETISWKVCLSIAGLLALWLSE